MTVSLANITSCKAFGDSYTVGNWATNFNGYIQQFCNSRGLTLTNNAVGGRTCGLVVYDIFKYHDPSSLNTLMIGINDLRLFSSSPTQTIEKIKGTVRSFLVSVFTDTIIPASSSDKSNFPSIDTYGRAQYLGGSSRRSGQNDYLRYRFTGSNVVIGFGASSSYSLGRAQVYIDGVLKTTINPMGLSDGENTIMPNAVVLSLPNANHELLIIAPDSSGASIDYIAILKNPSATTCAPAIVLNVPYLSPTGYSTFSSPQLNNSIIDQANAGIASIVNNEFSGYPVAIADTNLNFNPSTDASVNPDPWHRTDSGHTKIKSAMDAVVY